MHAIIATIQNPDSFNLQAFINHSSLVTLIMNYSMDQSVYNLGARRIGVTSLPPMGCLPAAITLFGGGNNGCVTRINNDAVAFNKKINMAAESLKRSHGDLRLVIFDIYKPLLDLINNPGNNGTHTLRMIWSTFPLFNSLKVCKKIHRQITNNHVDLDQGFFESRRACCGTGTIETSLLCNTRAPGTCSNATGYVFWDSFHPSEAANRVLSDALLLQGIDLIS